MENKEDIAKDQALTALAQRIAKMSRRQRRQTMRDIKKKFKKRIKTNDQ